MVTLNGCGNTTWVMSCDSYPTQWGLSALARIKPCPPDFRRTKIPRASLIVESSREYQPTPTGNIIIIVLGAFASSIKIEIEQPQKHAKAEQVLKIATP
jgi:hypothetical protein